ALRAVAGRRGGGSVEQVCDVLGRVTADLLSKVGERWPVEVGRAGGVVLPQQRLDQGEHFGILRALPGQERVALLGGQGEGAMEQLVKAGLAVKAHGRLLSRRGSWRAGLGPSASAA